MTISLVSGPLLGFDLVRHPRGTQIADTLLWALSLTEPDLPTCLAAATGAAGPARAAARAQLAELQDARLTAAVPAPAAPDASLTAMIETLRHSLITDLDDLIRLTRKDILDWTAAADSQTRPEAPAAAAIELIVDAIAADWFDQLPPADRQALTAALDTARAHLPRREPDIGPCTFEVHGVLDTLRGLDGDGRTRLRTVNAVLGAGRPRWAEAVNEACWAALTTGRIRAAASAQLLAAQAFIAGGLDAADGAEGVWNLISGHLQACVVADVLPTRTQLELGHGWLAALAE